MSDFKDNWSGTGSMDEFVAESNRLFKAMNNIKIIMPKDYVGAEPTLRFDGSNIVFDLNDALIYNRENTTIIRPDDVSSHSAFVTLGAESGRLLIVVIVGLTN